MHEQAEIMQVNFPVACYRAKGEVSFAFLKELIEIPKTDWKVEGKKCTA